MIRLLVFGGSAVLAAAWLIGLVGAWRGRPALAFWACALTILLGLFIFSSVFLLPHYSEFWFNDAGKGDRMGLLGFVLGGALIGGAGVIGLVLTGVLHLVRLKRNKKLEQGSR